MRRTLSALAVVLGLLGAVLALVPGSFAVSPASTEFRYGIVVGEGPPPTAGRFLFQADLVSGSNGVEGVPVQLQARPYGATSFTTVGNGTTTADGGIAISAIIRRSSELRWSFLGNPDYAATLSHSFSQVIAPHIAVRVADRTLKGAQRVVVTGTTNPLKPGTRVSLWRGDVPAFAPDLHMTRIAVGTIRADGTFRLTARFAHAGAKRLYVKVNGGHGTAEGYSRYLHIRVSR